MHKYQESPKLVGVVDDGLGVLQMERGTAMTDDSEAFAGVSGTLWAQREALEQLLFRLTEEHLIVTGGHTRWLPRADDEVREAVDRLRLGEVARSVETEALALAMGLPAEATLAQLAEAAPAPWSTLFDEHRTALRSLALEVRALTATNLRLLDAGARAIRESLDSITSSVSVYDATGSSVRPTGPVLLDEQA
jgi:hypothetical protein